MSEIRLTRRGAIRLAAAVAGGSMLAPMDAEAATAGGEVVAWINQHAVPLPRVDAGGDVDDLAALRGIVADAQVVGVGESTHGTHHQFTLKHRVARFLVERLGFRTIAWEENWGSGVTIDRYVTSGQGDVRAILADLGLQWRSQAMLDLIGWMRAFNRDRCEQDKVRFLGSDVMEVRALPFDEVTTYVRDVGPDRLAELEANLDPIRYRGSIQAHFEWLFSHPPEARRRFAHLARAAHDLVAALPAGPSSIDRQDAVQHARAIWGFYVTHSEPPDGGGRDRFIADTITWWQQRTGHRILYGAANIHTGASPRATYTFPPDPNPITVTFAGGHLRHRLGRSYLSIGTVFHAGEILAGWETGTPSVFNVPPPSEGFTDHVLGQADQADYLLDLHAKAPAPVRRWLDGPATMRLIGSAYDARLDDQYAMQVESWRGGFDAILHLGKVTPTRIIA